METDLLSLDHLLRLNGEVIVHLLLDLLDALRSLRPDKLDHAVHDHGGLLRVHFFRESVRIIIINFYLKPNLK